MGAPVTSAAARGGAVGGQAGLGSFRSTATDDSDLQPVFCDDFELGNFSRWPSATNMQITETDVHQGRYAARANSNGVPTFLRHRFYATEYSRLCYRIWVKHLGKAAGQTDELMQFRDRFGASIVTVLINTDGTLAYRNDFAGGVLRTSSLVVTTGVYHELQVCVRLIGFPRVETYYDGQPVPALSLRESLGSNRVRELILGDTRPGQTHHDVFDDIGAAANAIG